MHLCYRKLQQTTNYSPFGGGGDRSNNNKNNQQLIPHAHIPIYIAKPSLMFTSKKKALLAKRNNRNEEKKKLEYNYIGQEWYESLKRISRMSELRNMVKYLNIISNPKKSRKK